MSEPTPAELRTSDRRTFIVQRRWPLVSGAVALALGLLLASLIAIRSYEVVPYEIDQLWLDRLVALRAPFLDQIALFLNYTGGGLRAFLITPLVAGGVLALLRRYWAALFLVAALTASALLVQLVKNVVGRPRPDEMLVTSDFGSFPSGHAANAATLAVVLGIILHRWWVWAAGSLWVVAMMLSRNYLGVHWLTDTVGGLVLGVGVALIVWAPFANRLHREDLRRRPSAPSAPVRDAGSGAGGSA